MKKELVKVIAWLMIVFGVTFVTSTLTIAVVGGYRLGLLALNGMGLS